ncbi:antitoxin HicB [Fontimonas thermophila]|uniref:Antitoxin HicB n=1 Tax=Fontimonas thermophila TaxID=1076937 RepID=A0A1I2HDD2_9GAMM|nr:type II toxin-antitoxin system HicB family antitoxin [Fontimonas thermophila]SFF27373.1 antitoxin HicB [Fontimonas thermophila]
MTDTVRYMALLEPQPEGGYTVTFPDLPEAITEGDDIEQALFNAAEVLSLVLEQRLADGAPIPSPTQTEGGHWVEPSASVQAAVLLARARAGHTISELARAMGTSWPAAQRLMKPGNPTIKQLERAAAALGKRLVLSLE